MACDLNEIAHIVKSMNPQTLNAHVTSHDKPVRLVCEDGQALLSVLKEEEQQAMKQELDDINKRYQDVRCATSARQASLVEALLLSQQFRDIHKEVVTWLDRCDENFRKLDDEAQAAELQQERIKVRAYLPKTSLGIKYCPHYHLST